ncbi:hypothetical protein [Tropicimonas isoalkanivorans]|uniref:Uncharacterized protein n=1 Tax=Tropicimonas isoalkanivorans TaxID=441112 RepID=A0A1I1G2C9_9RHOB|nr:hypothetical protein [Tropicimonas isoalkanivorans]SFC03978.1 hypothetical protein SAMN04488094_102325 [Tropicimonas isoalkanivorans]
MKRMALGLVMVAAASSAQAASNMEQTVIADLRRDGVSEECIAKVTLNDAARITGIKNDPNRSDGSKNTSIKNQVKKICAR